MPDSFNQFPDHARLWLFASNQTLKPETATVLLRRVDEFLDQWHAHGHPVVGARLILHDHFLLVAADEQATGVSGCSIDSLFRVLQQVERELQVSLLDSSRVHYRDEQGAVRSVPRADFRRLVSIGEVGEDTHVFDNTISTMGDLRADRWEKPLRDSWHAEAFAPPPGAKVPRQ
ncbi:hypothetical protein BH23GEM6_BH23GEM6_08190 [soil metagenome]